MRTHLVKVESSGLPDFYGQGRQALMDIQMAMLLHMQSAMRSLLQPERAISDQTSEHHDLNMQVRQGCSY